MGLGTVGYEVSKCMIPYEPKGPGADVRVPNPYGYLLMVNRELRNGSLEYSLHNPVQ